VLAVQAMYVLYRSNDLVALPAMKAGEPVKTVPVMELAARLKGDGGMRPTGGGTAPRTPTSVGERYSVNGQARSENDEKLTDEVERAVFKTLVSTNWVDLREAWEGSQILEICQLVCFLARWKCGARIQLDWSCGCEEKEGGGDGEC
jgi:hypothetical protein